MPDIEDVLPDVKGAVRKLRRWLEAAVEGFPSIDRDDWWSYERQIAFDLVEGHCHCDRANCACEHTLTQWDAQERELQSFLYRAVIGPAGLQPNSIAQGMLYSHLRTEHNLLVVKVGFKHCVCGKRYEGTTCPASKHPFDPVTTLVKALDWLVIPGEYLTDVRWWACGEGRQAHYFAQQQCREIPRHNPDNYPEPSYTQQHGCAATGRESHDSCPVPTCPRHTQRHGLRGTILWQRAVFARGEEHASPSRPPLLLSLLEGLQETVDSLQGWQRMWTLFLAREQPASCTTTLWQDVMQGGQQFTEMELLTLAERLFLGREPGLLSYTEALRQWAQVARELHGLHDMRMPRTAREVSQFETEELRPLVRVKIERALQQHGLDDDTLLVWLQGEKIYYDQLREEDDNAHS